MRTLLFCVTFAMALAIPGELLAGGNWVPPYGPPMVVLGHDREPASQHRDVADGGESECTEPPDGDHNCDDPPVKGVPEPGPLPLLAVGLGVLALSRWRLRE